MSKRISDFFDNRLVAIVYNFLDILVHGRSNNVILREIAGTETAFRALMKSWFAHSSLFAILKAFAAFQRTPGVPGLDLPGLDIPMIARGLGAEAHRITSAADLPEAFHAAFQAAMSRPGPVLIDVAVDPDVGSLFGEPAS